MLSEKTKMMMPGNPRYQPIQMTPFFGYDNLYSTVAEVEIANLQVLADIEVIPTETIKLLTDEIIEQLKDISTTTVDEIERKITKHDIRAWVRRAQEIVPVDLTKWIHLLLTSYDPIDTGRSLQYQRAYFKCLRPTLIYVVELYAGLIKRFAGTLQIGRTHGQHAVPITAGFWLATILNRIIFNWQQMELHANGLVGKISGPVGAYNSQIVLGIESKCGEIPFEERVLMKLGIKPAPISTQIVPPEPLAYFLYACCMMSAALGQFGRDCRQLMRSEIGEVAESFEKNQVGSSTMAHKRNPISFENLEGTWLKTKNELGKVMDTLISEHQRDLVGSSIARDFPTILINLQQQLNTLTRKNDQGVPFLDRLIIDEESCLKNFSMNSDLITSEPIYIALQMAGYQGDAHHLVNHTLVPIAKKKGESLMKTLEEVAETQRNVKEALARIPEEVAESLWYPERYTGKAKERALVITNIVEDYIRNLN